MLELGFCEVGLWLDLGLGELVLRKIDLGTGVGVEKNWG